MANGLDASKTMYELLFLLGPVFLLVFLVIVYAVALLLWWLAKNKKRGWYIGFFVAMFIYSAFTTWYAHSGLSFMGLFLLGAWTYFITSIALWRAASVDKKLWFALIFIFGYLGILPAIYVWGVEKMEMGEWYY